MTTEPLETGARALATAYNFSPDDSWSDQAYDAVPAMAPPDVPRELPAWKHFEHIALQALTRCDGHDPHVTMTGSEDEKIFEALQTAGLVSVALHDEERKEWALTEAGEAARQQGENQ